MNSANVLERCNILHTMTCHIFKCACTYTLKLIGLWQISLSGVSDSVYPVPCTLGIPWGVFGHEYSSAP